MMPLDRSLYLYNSVTFIHLPLSIVPLSDVIV